MLNPKKIASIGLISGASVSVIAGGSFYLIRDTRSTIEDLLKSESPAKTLLGSNHVGKANNAWTKYKETLNGANSNLWNLDKWNEISREDKVPQALVDACNTKIKEKVKDKNQKEYTNFIKWCIAS